MNVTTLLPTQAEPLTLLHCLTFLKTWILQRHLWKFQISWHNFYPHYIAVHVCRLPIFFCPIEAKILSVILHCVEVWCVPSATHLSWEHQSQNIVLRFGVLVAFNSSILCSKCILLLKSKSTSNVDLCDSVPIRKSILNFSYAYHSVLLDSLISIVLVINLRSRWRWTFSYRLHSLYLLPVISGWDDSIEDSMFREEKFS